VQGVVKIPALQWILSIIDSLLSIKSSDHEVNELFSMDSSNSSFSSSTENISSTKFWHMQLHPFDLGWEKEKELL
jgi:hypothetical protein